MPKQTTRVLASYVDAAGARRAIRLGPGGLVLDMGPGGARCLSELAPDDGPRQVDALVAEYLRAPRRCRRVFPAVAGGANGGEGSDGSGGG